MTAEAASFMRREAERFAANLTRVKLLVALAEVYPWPPLATHRQDVLRAAVVFLHATLEDSLRYIGSRYLPEGSEETLNRVPLLGIGERPEKFFLGKLAAYRQRTVDDVISSSVGAYLARRSFSDTTDIATLLNAVGVPAELAEQHYAGLAALMERRHQIVHCADLPEPPEGTPCEPTPIAAETVKDWIRVVMDFTNVVVAGCIEHHFGARIRAARPDAAPGRLEGDSERG